MTHGKQKIWDPIDSGQISFPFPELIYRDYIKIMAGAVEKKHVSLNTRKKPVELVFPHFFPLHVENLVMQYATK